MAGVCHGPTCPHSLHAGWRVIQGSLWMLMATVVTSLAARQRDRAERSFFASLRQNAVAHQRQRRAERRALTAKLKTEAADARTTAFQNVMRYVCHELRNPLHGIMVRHTHTHTHGHTHTHTHRGARLRRCPFASLP